ncbi:hypothetical protein MN608_10060 [Microdochium nivale]|nr:hypothetical protein MN608_10060 [Microdochium nivale]
MHFTLTTLTVAAALLAAPAAAGFDSKACKNIGACIVPSNCEYTTISDPQDIELECGSAGTISGQTSAGARLQLWQGLSKGQVVARADFPRCNLAQPSATATLIKTTYEDVTIFGWIEYSCSETKPFDTCYFGNKNLSTAYTCKVYKNGQVCKNRSTRITDKNACPK